MRRPLAERQVMLAGVALLAVAVSLAITTRQDARDAASRCRRLYGNYTALAAATAARRRPAEPLRRPSSRATSGS